MKNLTVFLTCLLALFFSLPQKGYTLKTLAAPPQYYTLTSSDLTNDVNELITKCTYDLSLKYNVIPTVINGDTIKGIKSNLISGVFENKGIIGIGFPNTITTIGARAFYNNDMLSSNLINLQSLVTIGANAFASNPSIKVYLPINSSNNFNGWRDSNGDEYDGGKQISNYSVAYNAILAHILIDADVTISSGVILSCNYDYSNTDIIIPDFLNRQAVKSIWTDCFRNKNITSVLLPSDLTIIMSSAFYDNNIQRLDLSRCPDLETISGAAFGWNDLTKVDFSNCSDLEKIGNSAFVSNNLDTVDLSPCSSLNLIEGWSFNNNNLSSFFLPQNLNPHFTIWMDENDNRYKVGDVVSDLEIDYTAIINENIPEKDTLNDITFGNTQSDCVNAIKSVIVAENGNEVLFQNGSSVNLIAGQSVTLLPGTVIEPGAYVHAYITDTGEFCESIQPINIVSNNYINTKALELEPIEQFENSERLSPSLKVYPNPSNGRFTVQTSNFSENTTIQVINNTGTVVYATNVNTIETSFELNYLKHGLYFIRTINDKTSLTQRIVIR